MISILVDIEHMEGIKGGLKMEKGGKNS